MTTHPPKGYICSEPGVNQMVENDTNQIACIYQITVRGNLDPQWSSWFDGLAVSPQDDSPITTLTGPITDMAKLRGILNKLWDLNMSVISVNQLQDRIDERSQQ
jgi:hypothetical protein